MYITTNQPDTKSNPNPNPTIRQYAIVSIQLNIVSCPTHPEKFIRDKVVVWFLQLSTVTVIMSNVISQREQYTVVL